MKAATSLELMVNLKEDSPQKICEALSVWFIRVNCRGKSGQACRYQRVGLNGVRARHTSSLRRDVSIIADAEFCLANYALALGPWFSFETHQQNIKSPNLQGRDFSWSFGSRKLLHFDPEFVHVRNAIKALVLGFDTVNHSPPRCARRAVIHRSHPRTRVWFHTSC